MSPQTLDFKLWYIVKFKDIDNEFNQHCVNLFGEGLNVNGQSFTDKCPALHL